MAVLSRSLGFFSFFFLCVFAFFGFCCVVGIFDVFFLYFSCIFVFFLHFLVFFLIVVLISLFSAIRELPTPLRAIHAELRQRHGCRRKSLKNKSAPWNPAAHSQKCVLQISGIRMLYCVEFLKD